MTSSGFLENQDRGSGIGDRGSRTGDRGSRIKDQMKKKTITSQKFVAPDLHNSCCYYCLGSFILQDLFQVSKYLLSGGKVQNFPWMFISLALYIEPFASSRFSSLILFVLVRFSPETSQLYSEKGMYFSRNILTFLAAIWSSLCFSSPMYIDLFLLLVVLEPHDSD